VFNYVTDLWTRICKEWHTAYVRSVRGTVATFSKILIWKSVKLQKCEFHHAKENTFGVLFIVRAVPSAHARTWTTSKRWGRPVDRCSENGIWPVDGWVCVMDSRKEETYLCSKEVNYLWWNSSFSWSQSAVGGRVESSWQRKEWEETRTAINVTTFETQLNRFWISIGSQKAHSELKLVNIITLAFVIFRVGSGDRTSLLALLAALWSLLPSTVLLWSLESGFKQTYCVDKERYKGKAILQQAVKAHMVVRRRFSHIF
jgi:hypothetical protein